jgi:NAD+ synthase (glutamine-hydrolysing)
MAKVKVAGAALNQIPMHWANNLKNIQKAIEDARAAHVQILCLPELCLTGYGCEDLFLGDWLAEKALSNLPSIAAFTKNIAVAVGLPIRVHGNAYNCVAVLENGRLLGITAKQFLANDGVHYEPRWFTPWQAGQQIHLEINGQQVPFGDLTYSLFGVHTGFEICEDAWRKNRPACRMQQENIELIMNPSASHFALGKSALRQRLVIDSSRKFSCYYVYANLLGNEAGRMLYDGEIMMAGHGQMLQMNRKLSFEDVNLLAVEIDTEDKQPSTTIGTLPAEDRFEIFARAESLALFDYLRKSRSKGFVLSLSGGADSSTCALLVAEMVRRSLGELGLKKVLKKLHIEDFIEDCQPHSIGLQRKMIVQRLLHCAYQGTKNSSDKTLSSARKLASEIGAEFSEWKIDEEVASYSQKIEKALNRTLSWETDDISMQNIQARARSPIIWMLANIRQSLLIVTSNRSECDVGYSTMDGDTSGSIAPIAALDKHFILQWLKWAENTLDYQSLQLINSLTPSAELRPLENSQTDEDDLMPYAIIVEIEKLAIRERQSPTRIFEVLSATNLADEASLKLYIKKFFTLWSRNQWKRERTAPSFHLDDFNVDPRTWCRFPILSSAYFDELAELDHR